MAGLVEQGSNVKVCVDTDDAGELSEIYAKVIEARTAIEDNVTWVLLNFTSLPEDGKEYFEERRRAVRRT